MEIDEARLYQLLGERLKRRRTEIGRSQGWLATRVDLLRTSITNIEAGRQKPPLHVLYRLCEALDLQVAEILPVTDEVRLPGREEVALEDGVVARVPPKTAQFLRGLLDEPVGRPSC